ncbi:leucine-zipper-like transcriptional regulator 1 [Anaeramoeba ignava]|uniref:Leucine-zipper-like transcriptional regulator 1 n=1 Tax=Anaeramoeba ignava TaxID=1746090 RepID=A0A9Q0RGT0_ANAIG|nr:leucine-zipper-like transcriptional regulator 1 [Anaeramoeba ignava]
MNKEIKEKKKEIKEKKYKKWNVEDFPENTQLPFGYYPSIRVLYYKKEEAFIFFMSHSEYGYGDFELYIYYPQTKKFNKMGVIRQYLYNIYDCLIFEDTLLLISTNFMLVNLLKKSNDSFEIQTKPLNNKLYSSNFKSLYYDGTIYIYSGSEHINNFSFYEYDIVSDSLKMITHDKGNAPKPRSGASWNIYDDEIILYGGWGHYNDNDFIFGFNLKNEEWRIIEAKSSFIPDQRSGHGAVIYRHSLFIFGGKIHKTNKETDELLFFNFHTNTWNKIQTMRLDRPLAKRDPTVFERDGNMYVIGGSSYDVVVSKYTTVKEFHSISLISDLQRDLGNFLVSQDLTDFEIICSDGKSIRAHSYFLKIRSKLFKKEKEENENENQNENENENQIKNENQNENQNENENQIKNQNQIKNENENQNQIKNENQNENENENQIQIQNQNIQEITQDTIKEEDFLNMIKYECSKYPFEVVDSFIFFIYTGIHKMKFDDPQFSIVSSLLHGFGFNPKNGSEQLQKDMKDLYEDEESKDFTILIEDQKLQAHKMLLAARSELYRNMLLLNVNDTSNTAPDFSGRSFEAVKRFVYFLYTDELTNINEELADELYDCSEYYGMSSSQLDAMYNHLKLKKKRRIAKKKAQEKIKKMQKQNEKAEEKAKNDPAFQIKSKQKSNCLIN